MQQKWGGGEKYSLQPKKSPQKCAQEPRRPFKLPSWVRTVSYLLTVKSAVRTLGVFSYCPCCIQWVLIRPRTAGSLRPSIVLDQGHMYSAGCHLLHSSSSGPSEYEVWQKAVLCFSHKKKIQNRWITTRNHLHGLLRGRRKQPLKLSSDLPC